MTEASEPSAAPPSDLSFADKYTDAFWRVTPIPLLVGADVIGVILRPSTAGLVALLVVAVAGLLVELVILRDLRRRWSAGVPRSSIGSLGEPSGAAMLVLFGVLLWGGWTVKGHGTQGMSWGEAALFALILLPIYAALIALLAGVAHLFGSRE